MSIAGTEWKKILKIKDKKDDKSRGGFEDNYFKKVLRNLHVFVLFLAENFHEKFNGLAEKGIEKGWLPQIQFLDVSRQEESHHRHDKNVDENYKRT